MTTAVSGRAAVIRPAAVMPLPGMWMSSRATSGACSTHASKAAAALAASAQTVKPDSSSDNRTPARVGGWSSATTTRRLIGTHLLSDVGTTTVRRGSRQCDLNGSSALESRDQRERAAERLGTLTHARQPEPAGQMREVVGVEAAAVILH